MSLKIDDKVILNGIHYTVVGGHSRYHLWKGYNNQSDLIFSKLKIPDKYAYVSSVVGYKVTEGTFPQVGTLGDLLKVIEALRERSRSVFITGDHVVALIENGDLQAREIAFAIIRRDLDNASISYDDFKSMASISPTWVTTVEDDVRPHLVESYLRRWLKLNPGSQVGRELAVQMFTDKIPIKLNRAQYTQFCQEACTEADAIWLADAFRE